MSAVHDIRFGVELLTPYRSDGRVEVQFPGCGHRIEVAAYSLRRNANKNGGEAKCPICDMEERTLSYQEVRVRVAKTSQREYKVLGFEGESFGGARTKLKILHKTCGREFLMPWRNFQEGKRCPHCARESSTSKAHRLLKRLLEHTGIEFVEEAEFDELINPISGSKLFCDFWLPQLKTIIEVDGVQHAVAVERWGGAKGVTDTIFRDRCKTEFAKKNGYRIIRVPLYDKETLRQKPYDEVKAVVFNLLLFLHREIKGGKGGENGIILKKGDVNEREVDL